VWPCRRAGKPQKRVSIGKTRRRRTTATASIAEETGQEERDEEDGGEPADPTPLVTALLRPRMLELRAAYSQQATRRDRLAFLRQHAVVGGAEQGRVLGERLIVDSQPLLRRRPWLRPERRPPGVMGVRASDRREEEVAVLREVLPADVELLEPPPPAADDGDDSSTLSATPTELSQRDDDDAPRPRRLSRTLENWTGLSYVSSGGVASPGSPTGRKKHQ